MRCECVQHPEGFVLIYFNGLCFLLFTRFLYIKMYLGTIVKLLCAGSSLSCYDGFDLQQRWEEDHCTVEGYFNFIRNSEKLKDHFIHKVVSKVPIC